MADLGYGDGYEYSHDYPLHMTDMVCLPDKLKDRVYYAAWHAGQRSQSRPAHGTDCADLRKVFPRTGRRLKRVNMTLHLETLDDTKKLAEAFARQLKDKTMTITLDGDLGAGKTAWTRFFGQALGVKANDQLAHLYDYEIV